MTRLVADVVLDRLVGNANGLSVGHTRDGDRMRRAVERPVGRRGAAVNVARAINFQAQDGDERGEEGGSRDREKGEDYRR